MSNFKFCPKCKGELQDESFFNWFLRVTCNGLMAGMLMGIVMMGTIVASAKVFDKYLNGELVRQICQLGATP